MRKIPPHLTPYVMKEHEPASVAFYRLSVAELYCIILVVDGDERLTGVLTLTDFQELPLRGVNPESMCVGQICNRSFRFLLDTDDKYLCGRNIFAELPIEELPILNTEHIPVDLFARWQAFFREYSNNRTLNYPYYAANIMSAAKLAMEKGYDRISVIEFGVAGGRGLRHCELFAKETEKLTGIGIQVYGFDSGRGLFAPKDYRDRPNAWIEGEFKTDIEKLKSSMQYAKLIIGDICDTAKTFLAEYDPAPIGAMLIDVDQYTPTVAILDLLLDKDDYFLPSIYMYFDDIGPYDIFQGETLAIKEFNSRSENVKISPETWSYNPYYPTNARIIWWAARLKVCHRFKHEKFAKTNEAIPRMLPIRY